jgi:hypothetical protein
VNHAVCSHRRRRPEKNPRRTSGSPNKTIDRTCGTPIKKIAESHRILTPQVAFGRKMPQGDIEVVEQKIGRVYGMAGLALFFQNSARKTYRKGLAFINLLPLVVTYRPLHKNLVKNTKA